MRNFSTILLTIATIALAMPANADHCTTYSTSNPEVTTGGEEGAVHYVDNDLIFPEGVSIWVYEESNGIDGLQRGDEVVDDTCHGLIEADTIIV